MVMMEAALIEAVYRLVVALFGLLFAMLGLRLMDRGLRKTPFGKMVNGWSDVAQAQYYSGRLVAVALVIGLALS